jgi:hypothetical protein
MDRISELTAILGKKFAWNKARLDCFSRMLLALFKVRTVNLSEIAVGFEAKASVESRYKRLYRFFRQFKMDYATLALWMVDQFALPKKFYVTIDRTNWFWGKGKINILTVAIAYEGIAIPVVWQALGKAGNASALEHQAILQRFIDLFGTTRIQGILADREFASGDLFGWLNQQKIPFYIRIKEDSLVKMKNKTVCKAVAIFNDLQPKIEKHFPMNVWLYGQRVYLSGSRADNGELMIVATHQHADNAISIYLRRWEIETLFSCLKGRGFRFEDTHITHCDRIEKVMALLAVAFCWAHKIGEWRAEKKPIPFKRFRQSIRPQHSLFRYGFNFIRELILNTRSVHQHFQHCLNFLTGPPHPI